MYGRLTVICGPMYAGKTTELLKRILWARNGEHKAVLVVKPSFDDRYSPTNIVSHDGLLVEAKAITEWAQVTELSYDAELVCIDEVQFLQEPNFVGDIVEIIRALLAGGKDVVVNGLDMDWRGVAFDITAKLMAMADEIIKEHANCTVCGQPATKTHKKSQEFEITETGEAVVQLGGTELYEARCNRHWNY